ncbi:hypothetical protein HK101_007610, partial [Irineochytrium annulatum]
MATPALAGQQPHQRQVTNSTITSNNTSNPDPNIASASGNATPNAGGGGGGGSAANRRATRAVVGTGSSKKEAGDTGSARTNGAASMSSRPKTWMGLYQAVAKRIEDNLVDPRVVQVIYAIQIFLAAIGLVFCGMWAVTNVSLSILLYITQIIFNAFYLIYKSKLWPGKPVPQRKMAWFDFAFYIYTAGATLSGAGLVLIYQNDMSTEQLKCCESGSYLFDLSECYVYGNVTDQRFDLCPKDMDWRVVYNNTQFFSYSLAIITLWQGLIHHCASSAIVRYITSGVILSATPSGADGGAAETPGGD